MKKLMLKYKVLKILFSCLNLIKVKKHAIIVIQNEYVINKNVFFHWLLDKYKH